MWRTALHLDQALTGSTLTASDFRVPAHATLDLSGRVVEGTVARGKHLLTRVGPADGVATGEAGDAGADAGAAVTLHTHLKMEGSWHLYRPDTRWRRPTHEARVVLRTQRLDRRGLRPGGRRGGRPGRRGHRRRPSGAGPARSRLGRGRGAAAAAGRPRAPGRRGAARPAQPGRDRQPVRERDVLPRRGAPAAAGRRGPRPGPAGAPGPCRAARRTRAGCSRPSPETCARVRRPGSTGATAGPAVAAARGSGWTCRDPRLQERATYWCPSCQPGG